MSANSLISIVALIVGIGFTAGASRLAAMLEKSQSWQLREGVIVSSEVIEERNTKRTRYRPSIEYSFDVNGREYRSRQVKLGGEALSVGRGEAQQRADAYPPGREVLVYYDPADPRSSCLERSASPVPVLRWIGVAAFALAAAIQLRVVSI